MMFWKKKKSTEGKSQNVNRIDELANKLQAENRIETLENELGKFDPNSLASAEKESWYHLWGIIPFRAGNRELAFQRFQDGLQNCPDSSMLNFSLGQEYEYRGEIEKMLECFSRTNFPDIPAQYVLAEARYAYLWNKNEDGLKMLRPLMDTYFNLKNLDSTFLYLRGIPFFEQTWRYIAAFSVLMNQFDTLLAFTSNAEKECSDFDFDYLRAELQAIKDNDNSELKTKINLLVEDSRKHKGLTGLSELRLAVLKAQGSPDLTEANAIVEGIKFSENDFPWLDDMRLLAKCELAHRWGQSETENRLKQELFSRQPLLFEPDNAITFNLLKYQENIKGLYRNSRRDSSP